MPQTLNLTDLQEIPKGPHDDRIAVFKEQRDRHHAHFLAMETNPDLQPLKI